MTVLLALLATAALRSEFGLGADYSSQQYSVLRVDSLVEKEEDTLDIETEAKASWSVGLALGGTRGTDTPRTQFNLDNALSLTTRSVRDRLALALELPLAGPLHLRAANEAEFRYYHEALPQLADTAFGGDYLDNSTQLGLEWRPGGSTTVELSDRLQYCFYPKPDSYNQSYAVNRLSCGVRQDLALLSSLRADYDWSLRPGAALDGQQHAEHRLDAGVEHYFGTGSDISLSGAAGRRTYPAPERSYWEIGPDAGLGLDVTDHVRLSLGNESRWTWFDSTTDVYRDLFENTAKLGLEVDIGSALALRAGPQYALGLSLPSPTDDDFRELSLAVGFDLLLVDRLWLSAEDRIGRRRYPRADSGFQSNYTFNELSLNANWTIVRGLSMDAMLSFSPEWHAVESDDFITRIFTLELKYGL